MSILLLKNGLKKKVATGYSWKSLFFGVFYALFRGDTRGALTQLVYAFFTGGISWFFIPFTYNKRYIKRLIESGFGPADEKAEKYLTRKYSYSKPVVAAMAVLLVSVFMLSCNKDEVDPVVPPTTVIPLDSVVVDTITEEVINLIEYTLDGIDYTTNPELIWEVQTYGMGNQWGLILIFKDTIDIGIITIYLDTDTLGDVVNKLLLNTDLDNRKIQLTLLNGTVTYSSVDVPGGNNDGYIELTGVDHDNQLFSGTFEARIFNPSDSTYHDITNGVFTNIETMLN